MQQQSLITLSTNQLQFHHNQKARNIKLTNNSSKTLLYKIKTNNLDVLQANPNRGFLQANDAISLLIKNKKLDMKMDNSGNSNSNKSGSSEDGFQATLRISYAEQYSTGYNFTTQWSSLKKSQIRTIDVRIYKQAMMNTVNVAKNINNANNNNNVNSNKQKELPPSSMLFSLTKPISSINNNNQTYQAQLQIQPEQQTAQQQKLSQLHQQLEYQKIASNKLNQQLSTASEKLQFINKERLQIKVNKSIRVVCEDFHPSMTTYLLFLLVIFVGGFLVGKIIG